MEAAFFSHVTESTSALFLLFAFLIFMMISRALEERWGSLSLISIF